jgi:hypothetical protein
LSARVVTSYSRFWSHSAKATAQAVTVRPNSTNNQRKAEMVLKEQGDLGMVAVDDVIIPEGTKNSCGGIADESRLQVGAT